MSGELVTDAVVLRRLDYGESDRVVWLLTEARGRLSAFAPGARASRRRFPGGIEPFSFVRARLSPPRRGELWRLVELDLLEPRPSVRQSLECFAQASVACEIATDLSREADPVPELYQTLLRFLRGLDRTPGPSLFRHLLEALAASGVAPRLTSCGCCGGPIGAQASFDPAEGGVLCDGCAPRAASAVRVSGRALGALSSLEDPGTDEPIPEARALLWRHLEQQTGRRLASRKLLEELGLG